MRLRQIALVSRSLDTVVAQFEAVFGLQIGYRDPGIIKYGLRNAVLPAGTGFIEVVEPVTAEASAARFWDRLGGDGGYMVILQTADAAAETARIAGLGARVVETIDRPDYLSAHFHPADFAGVLVSVDEQRTEPDLAAPFGDWAPAGDDWRGARTPLVRALSMATITSPDPAGMAALWSRLLQRPLDPASERLDLGQGGEIRFRAGAPQSRAAFSGVTLEVEDVAAVRQRAQSLGLLQADGAVRIGGLDFELAALRGLREERRGREAD